MGTGRGPGWAKDTIGGHVGKDGWGCMGEAGATGIQGVPSRLRAGRYTPCSSSNKKARPRRLVWKGLQRPQCGLVQLLEQQVSRETAQA